MSNHSVVMRIGAAYDEVSINGTVIDRAKARMQIAASGRDFKQAYRSFNEEIGRAICLTMAIKGNRRSRKDRHRRRQENAS